MANVKVRAVVLGVDPGGRETGLVVRCGSDVRAHVTARRDGDTTGDGLVERDYCAAVADHAAELIDAHGVELVAVEDVTHPTPHMGLANVAGLVGTAAVAGAVVVGVTAVTGVSTVMVRPGGHGQAPYSTAYPRVLHDPRGGCRGGTRAMKCDQRCIAPNGSRRHERAAYDVAQVGRLEVWRVSA